MSDGALTFYDLRTGRLQWFVETDVESPSRPVLAGDRVYILAGDGRIVCLSHATGEVLWRSAERRDPNRRLVNEVDSIVGPPGSQGCGGGVLRPAGSTVPPSGCSLTYSLRTCGGRSQGER
ncbi:PQQ-binding-like beta-propeller repeat protein [Streptomyces sp. NPDC058548]|uniref:outer membrane protein assembly factor BamB family protein n=1 Tax=Streptomyces sp. NPDC058548 TaxID=3346545 RepID=UPI00365E9A8F